MNISKRAKILISIAIGVIVLLVLLFTVPLATIKAPSSNFDLYVNDRLVESKSTTSAMGLKTIAIANQSTAKSNQKIFVLPFSSYVPKQGNNQKVDSIMKEAAVDVKQISTIQSSKFFSNGKWLVVYSGINQPDAQKWLSVLNYRRSSGSWEIVFEGAGFDEDANSQVPNDVYDYIISGGTL